jgi:hypothetical protein
VKRAGLSRDWAAPRSAFAGFRFPADVIVVAVRWYLRYGLSYRDVEELLAERQSAQDVVDGAEAFLDPRGHQAQNSRTRTSAVLRITILACPLWSNVSVAVASAEHHGSEDHFDNREEVNRPERTWSPPRSNAASSGHLRFESKADHLGHLLPNLLPRNDQPPTPAVTALTCTHSPIRLPRAPLK